MNGGHRSSTSTAAAISHGAPQFHIAQSTFTGLAHQLGGLARSAQPLVVDAVAGTVGGACCVAVGHPFDTAKVLMQAQSTTTTQFARGGTLSCLAMILRTRGVRHGLYAGSGAALLANASENALLFMSYAQILHATDAALARAGIPADAPVAALGRGAVAGSLAAVVASVVLCPIELVKCRVQTGDGGASTMRCAAQVVARDGVQGLFRGFNATVLREVPGNVAFFGVYEGARAAMERRQIFASDDARVLTAGGLGGMAFWIVALPADAIKTQQQLFPGGLSVRETARRIHAAEGLRGFYRGLVPTLGRAFPSNAALFWGVERTRSLLDSLLPAR